MARAPAAYVGGPTPEAIGIKLATPWVEGAWDNDPEADANVAFIVRACNAHYDLLAALRKIADMTDIEADFDGFEAREIALAALASADTLPKGQDAKQGLAGTEGGAVPHVDEADAQTPSRNPSSNNSRKV